MRATGDHPDRARADELDLTVPARVDALPEVRTSVAGWLRVQGVAEADLGSVQVVVSELVANAIEASQPGDAVAVALRSTDGQVAVEVRNPSRRVEPVPIPPMADPLAPRGRGLAIVASLTDDLSLREIGGQTVAQGTLRLSGAGQGA